MTTPLFTESFFASSRFVNNFNTGSGASMSLRGAVIGSRSSPCLNLVSFIGFLETVLLGPPAPLAFLCSVLMSGLPTKYDFLTFTAAYLWGSASMSPSAGDAERLLVSVALRVVTCIAL